MMVPYQRGIRGMKMYARVIWHDWKNHFESVFPRRKTEVPPAGLFIAAVPNRCADAADYPSRLVDGALYPWGREVKVERFTLKCILITYYQRVSEGRKEDI